VLGMIEINLLPPEYRAPEGTNLPLIAALAIGVLVVGFTGLYGMNLSNELAQVESDLEKRLEDRPALEELAKKVDNHKADIGRQTSRQDTIIKISQSKVMWSLKLDQFARIMNRFSTFWVTNMQLTQRSSRSSGVSGQLNLQLSATGRDLNDVSRFRDALKHDTNFAYHFQNLPSPQVQIQSLSGYVNATERMVFRITVPLVSLEEESTGRGRKKKK
jgi:hypothetical protein